MILELASGKKFINVTERAAFAGTTRSLSLEAVNHGSNRLKIVLSSGIQLRPHVITLKSQPNPGLPPQFRASAKRDRKSIVAIGRLRKHVHAAQQAVSKGTQSPSARCELHSGAVENISRRSTARALRAERHVMFPSTARWSRK